MTNFPRVTAILNAIPDAATRWPGWMWPCCPLCLGECDMDAKKNPFCGDKNCDNYWQETPLTPVMRFAPITDEVSPDAWHGNDLDPRNMHHLWEMLEAVDMAASPSIHHIGGLLRATIWLDLDRERFGCSINIIEAMLRCLEEATK